MTKRFKISLFLSVMIHTVILLFIIRIKTPDSNSIINADKDKLEMNFIVINKPIRKYSPKISQLNVENVKTLIPESKENFNLNKITVPNIREKRLTLIKNDTINDTPLLKSHISKDNTDNEPLVLPDTTKEPEFIPGIEESIQNLKTENQNRVKGSVENSIFEWKGSKREIERAYPMPMPNVLKKIGQNVDVKAEVVVNDLGNVEKVKIIKSSGFLEVDNAVENALLRYKFTPSSDKEKETGVVFIKFILEMGDRY